MQSLIWSPAKVNSIIDYRGLAQHMNTNSVMTDQTLYCSVGRITVKLSKWCSKWRPTFTQCQEKSTSNSFTFHKYQLVSKYSCRWLILLQLQSQYLDASSPSISFRIFRRECNLLIYLYLYLWHRHHDIHHCLCP